MKTFGVILLSCFALTLLIDVTNGSNSFTIDYENDRFLMDGLPFRYIGGEIHYFRVPQEYWFDRLFKMKSAGINVLQTYIEWSGHEPREGVYKFDGNYNVTRWIEEAQKAGLYVLLRVGPYICSERDMGGLPWWLMKYDLQLRRNNDIYMKYVKQWFSVLLPMIKPYLYQNGGPIIMVQLENEYGYYSACDNSYMSSLRDIVRSHLGDEIILYTTDNPGLLACGLVDDVFATIDFGTNTQPDDQFKTLRAHRASGPLVNSEFWIGNIDTWGTQHLTKPVDEVTKWLDVLLSYDKNMSLSMYMFHGGTSFGFGSGANNGGYLPRPTTYDVDALLDEAGDPTEKYRAVKNVISKYAPVSKEDIEPSPKLSIGPIDAKLEMDFTQLFSQQFWKKVDSDSPQPFEYLGSRNGLILYSTTIDFKSTSPSMLTINALRDRAYVYIDKVFQGVVSRQEKSLTIPIRAEKGSRLDLIVENQGRTYFGDEISQHKGIFGSVTLGSKTLTKWSHYFIDDWEDFTSLLQFDANVPKQQSGLNSKNALHPAILKAEFVVPFTKTYDTYFNPTNLSKGFAYLNGKCLGRYWPTNGPQITLYTPGVWLKPSPQVNQLILVELEDPPCLINNGTCQLTFDDHPTLNGETPVNW